MCERTLFPSSSDRNSKVQSQYNWRDDKWWQLQVDMNKSVGALITLHSQRPNMVIKMRWTFGENISWVMQTTLTPPPRTQGSRLYITYKLDMKFMWSSRPSKSNGRIMKPYKWCRHGKHTGSGVSFPTSGPPKQKQVFCDLYFIVEAPIPDQDPINNL